MLSPTSFNSIVPGVNINEPLLVISEPEQEYLELLKDWLSTNPKINARRDDVHLLYFLRGCKFDLDRTKEKIKRFYIMKADRTEWFSDRNPLAPEIQELLEIGVFLPLNVKDELNRRIIVIRTAAHNPKIHKQNDVFKVGKMILDLALQLDPEIASHGLAVIFDMQDVTLSHALQLKPTLIKRSVESWQTYPCRPKILEFVNAPRHVNVALNMFRLFMSTKMKNRVIVRKGTSTMNATLPVDLGGTGESYEELAKHWKKLVEYHTKFFEEDEQYKYRDV